MIVTSQFCSIVPGGTATGSASDSAKTRGSPARASHFIWCAPSKPSSCAPKKEAHKATDKGSNRRPSRPEPMFRIHLSPPASHWRPLFAPNMPMSFCRGSNRSAAPIRPIIVPTPRRSSAAALADGFVPFESDRRPLPDPPTSFANTRYFRPVRPKRPASTSGTRSSNPLSSSRQSVSAVNRRPLPEEPRGFAALGACTGT